MTTRQDIEDMINRVALNDRAAFEALYSATSAKLFGIILRVLKDRAASEDVLQDVYLRLWQGGAQTFATGRASPISWLATIARNRAIDRLRRVKPESNLDGVAEPRDPALGPEGLAVAASERAMIDACLDELQPDRATAVRGAYLDGDTYADLAARFDVPLNTMRTWLRRSLMSLKDCLSR
ncbi:RNA polymerase sigma-70 factor, ECF subfamily [Octadecabacter temperatus]|uniref:ECF RNA polymerase sigma factor SigK n=1 Tax=Octadecabacter temperatus TaxID=1458307 RepID=A0A0K0Y488_9RHOB|nr:sigma-70 family RNA polymerase sigma factor [Octadecabacter temperatus]AKS45682.1 ECF RNA polymerase sigma factor SigK [Octadecabacter temperatus]SIN98255.1 RNA polymerase sigma-70 factor, ECF subfamily [Octadecabacter temperatus]